MNVEIVKVGPKKLACVRHAGPYQESFKAWGSLMARAASKGLQRPEAKYLGFSHDDPNVTPAAELRYDACITVHDGAEGDGDVQISELVGGEYAKYLHKGPYDGLMKVYSNLYTKWLPESGREARHEPPFGKCLNDPNSTPPEDLLTEVYIPLE
ncbi:GyrI-like domain-containing protein [Oceanidesulfovibrio indonesiensis]|uniref:GyrI-like domain-containing protein n=1 Tax=Oceanidesulfovibrio indonesiensis TaxID=54767 RepID=A0A7M3MAW4_9BACT|nr:GyrI-like domain-containing protein [Oceanidesulfovibrio indonesiensis]TVM14531.1 GyrI-like domain-containing protein [Oceanidesulfovibrio indonesiensis]